jgi:hypothetical protein
MAKVINIICTALCRDKGYSLFIGKYTSYYKMFHIKVINLSEAYIFMSCAHFLWSLYVRSIVSILRTIFEKCEVLCELQVKYEGVSKSFRTESITKYTLTFGITRWEATERVMAAKLIRLTHKIAIQLHLMSESCTIWSSPSRRPIRKLLDTPSYILYRIDTHQWNFLDCVVDLRPTTLTILNVTEIH